MRILRKRFVPMARWIKTLIFLGITLTVLSSGARAHGSHEHRLPVANSIASASVANVGNEMAVVESADVSRPQVDASPHPEPQPHALGGPACCCQGATSCGSSGGHAQANLNSSWSLLAADGSRSKLCASDTHARSQAPQLRLDRPPKA